MTRRTRADFQQQLNAWERSIQSRRGGAGAALRNPTGGLGPGSAGRQKQMSDDTYLNAEEQVEQMSGQETKKRKTQAQAKQKARAAKKKRISVREQARRKGRTVQSQKRINKVTKVAKKVVKRQKAAGKKITMKQARTRARRIIRRRR